MGKQTGLGANFYVSQYDLSGDTQALGRIGGGFAPVDVTGIDKSAFERIAGVRDASIDWTSHFNTAASQQHVALSSLPTSDRILTYVHRAGTLGTPGACMTAKQINYDPSRDAAGVMTIAVNAQANGFGLEWGTLHTAGKETHSSATSSTSVDGAAETDYGLQAYLHIFSVGSGTPTVKLQESSDNGSGDAWADVTGGAFTIQAAGAERIATANDQTIERYLRVTTTGTFTDLVMAVVVVRNLVAGTVF